MTLEVDVFVTAPPTQSLTAEDAQPHPVTPSAVPVFGAAKGTAAFVLLLLAQLFTGVWVVVVAMMFAMATGENVFDPTFANRVMAAATAPLLVTVGIASAVVAFVVAHVWAWHLLGDTTSAGLGLKRATRPQTFAWAIAGFGFAICYLAIVYWVVPYASGPLGPLASAAAGGGINRVAWAILALLLAPVVEEFFFRGLLLNAFTSSWGPRLADGAVTLLFISLHLFETFNYWPATAAVTTLGVATLVARRTTGSLVPAIALHASYNLILVLAVFIASMR